MEELYKILKSHPGCKIVMAYRKDSDVLSILATSSKSSSVPGMTADEVRTVFSAGKRLSINIIIPSSLIDGSGIERVLAEVKWAIQELESFEESVS